MGLCASVEQLPDTPIENPSRGSFSEDEDEELEQDSVSNLSNLSRRKSRRKSFMRSDTDSIPSVLTPSKRKPSMYVQIGDFVVDSIDHYYEPCIPMAGTKPDPGQPFFPEVVSSWSYPGVELGKGQFGTVARAVNKQHGYVSALKAVKKPRKANARLKDVNALKNEVKLLTKLTGHPSIVSLYEVIETATHIYLSQEICQGEELFNAISHYGNFSERDAASVMSDILSALAYMHSHDIMHRDLKPENILLTIKAQDTGVQSMEASKNRPKKFGSGTICAVKLVDFGLATFDTVKSAAKAGTPYYIAPEVLQATSRNPYGRECDLWSAGVIMYIMLCGYPPFYGDTDSEIYSRITHGFADLEGGSFPPEDWNIVSQGAKDLIRLLLQPVPEDRPTAEEARKHNWIQKEGPSLPKALHSAVMRKLTKFQRINKFKQVAKRIIAEEIDERDITHLREAFDAYDTDKSGTISINELKSALEAQAKTSSGKRKSWIDKVNTLFDRNSLGLLEQMDIDGDGQIDYKEFLVATMKTKHWHTQEKLMKAFDKLDCDNSGFLEREEVLEALGGSEYHITHEILEKFDVDGDGRISFEEFENMMLQADDLQDADFQ
eukprot:g3146.t1